MKKRGLIIIVCVVLLAAVVYICIHFFPSSPEGYMDIVEVGEIEKYTEEELQDRMLGQYRVNIDERWGETNRTERNANTDVYEFDEISCKIILTYDTDGKVIGLECNKAGNESHVRFGDSWVNKDDLSEETLEWLDWYNSLSEDEQLSVSAIPSDLLEESGISATEDTEATNN